MNKRVQVDCKKNFNRVQKNMIFSKMVRQVPILFF
eukprot:UN11994